ncbi:hypothetical protein HFO18_30700 [Rhizobium laguerreae]|nr:hypothetical protein [Rhizobium laguerreae]NKM25505.1 hypothetical protein [Rhizobium laguerreae]TBY07087.1 hypothetical protein E0J21_16380 [Rhizobium laguerreae]
MADSRRSISVNAVLAFLVAVALLLAPAAGVQAMQCLEHPSHEQFGLQQSVLPAIDAHASVQGPQTSDHIGCCALQCGFCVVLTRTEGTATPAATASFLNFAWGDQTRSGMTVPPALGPPRRPV